MLINWWCGKKPEGSTKIVSLWSIIIESKLKVKMGRGLHWKEVDQEATDDTRKIAKNLDALKVICV